MNSFHKSQTSDSSSELAEANIDHNSPQERINIFSLDKNETEELTKKS